MDGADVCRTSSRASRRPPYIISTVAILDPRWLRRKWRHPGPGAGFSTPIAEAEENGGPSASGRHLGWPHLREPEMRSSKMATGSGRAAIFLRLRNGGRKNRPILLLFDIFSSEPDFLAENQIFKNFSKSLKTYLVVFFWEFHGIFSIIRHLSREPDFLFWMMGWWDAQACVRSMA